MAMATITAIYEKGVFRPTESVNLPEGTPVQVLAPDEVLNVRALAPPGTDEDTLRVYEILARRFDSGYQDTAERHNEHQP
jgi:predicted DNA-binding antitoxin AbrB/MazE fold protein